MLLSVAIVPVDSHTVSPHRAKENVQYDELFNRVCYLDQVLFGEILKKHPASWRDGTGWVAQACPQGVCNPLGASLCNFPRYRVVWKPRVFCGVAMIGDTHKPSAAAFPGRREDVRYKSGPCAVVAWEGHHAMRHAISASFIMATPAVSPCHPTRNLLKTPGVGEGTRKPGHSPAHFFSITPLQRGRFSIECSIFPSCCRGKP